MDPISLIVTALVAGASAALKDSAGDAIKAVYDGLKSLLKRKLAGDLRDQLVVDQHEQEPDDFDKPLRSKLTKAKAGDDAEIIEAARAVLRITNPEETAQGKYNVHVSGGQGTVIGEHNTVTQTYNNPR